MVKFSATQFLDTCYTEIDNFLLKVYQEKGVSFFELNDLDANVTAVVKQVVDRYSLVEAAVPLSATSLQYLTPTGAHVLEIGIRAFLVEEERQSKRDDSIQELTHRKLTFEQIPAQYWIVPLIINSVLAGLVALIVSYYSR